MGIEKGDFFAPETGVFGQGKKIEHQSHYSRK